jgi:hypothetical protein
MTFPCIPACSACKLAGNCTSAPRGVVRASKPPKVPYNHELNQRTRLKCGCTIEGPLFHCFGKDIKSVFCSEHGETKVIDDKPKRRAKRHAEIPGQQDLPPF